MSQSGVNYVKFYPERFFEYMRDNRYPVFHKSPVFLRDFQYGLWRFLQENQTKVPYADMERIAAEVIEEFTARGILKTINRQTFELNMPEFIAVAPSLPAPSAPKGKPAPASGPAAKEQPAATPVAGESAAAPAAAPAASSSAPVTAADVAQMTPEQKAAKLAEIQAKMAEAKAKRLAGG
jgi:hypothetical protein